MGPVLLEVEMPGTAKSVKPRITANLPFSQLAMALNLASASFHEYKEAYKHNTTHAEQLASVSAIKEYGLLGEQRALPAMMLHVPDHKERPHRPCNTPEESSLLCDAQHQCSLVYELLPALLRSLPNPRPYLFIDPPRCTTRVRGAWKPKELELMDTIDENRTWCAKRLYDDGLELMDLTYESDDSEDDIEVCFETTIICD